MIVLLSLISVLIFPYADLAFAEIAHIRTYEIVKQGYNKGYSCDGCSLPEFILKADKIVVNDNVPELACFMCADRPIHFEIFHGDKLLKSFDMKFDPNDSSFTYVHFSLDGEKLSLIAIAGDSMNNMIENGLLALTYFGRPRVVDITTGIGLQLFSSYEAKSIQIFRTIEGYNDTAKFIESKQGGDNNSDFSDEKIQPAQ